MTALTTIISNFTGNTSVLNTVAGNVTAINGLAAGLGSFGDKLPGAGTALTDLTAMTTAATAITNDLISKLPVALPAMKAVHLLEKKMEMADGGLASTAGSTSFAAYFNVLPAVEAQMAALAAVASGLLGSIGTAASGIPGVTAGAGAFASLAALIPSPTIPDPLNPLVTITNPAFTTFNTTNSSAMSAITTATTGLTTAAAGGAAAFATMAASAEGLFQSGMASLKALSFARFCATPQPVAVQAVINSLIVPANIPSVAKLNSVNAAATKWSQSQPYPLVVSSVPVGGSHTSVQRLALPKVTPSPVVFTPSTSTAPALAVIKAQVTAQDALVVAALALLNTSAAAVNVWQVANDYERVRTDRHLTVATEAAYDTLTATLLSLPASALYNTRLADWNAKMARYAYLEAVHNTMELTGPPIANPTGPW